MQVKTLRKAEKPAFVYKMHRNDSEKSCCPSCKKVPIPLFSVMLSTVFTALSTAFVYNF